MQNITSEWKYYNHALIPTCAPHETPDFSVIEDGSAWKNGGVPFLHDGHRNTTIVPTQTGGILCRILHMNLKIKRSHIEGK